jgi:signal transduction histidine kinase
MFGAFAAGVMGRVLMAAVTRLGLALWLRVGLALLVIAMAVGERHPASVLPGTAALLLVEVVPTDLASRRTQVVASAVICALTVGLSVRFTQAALPLLLFPAFRVGEEGRARTVLIERLGSGVAVLAVMELLGRPSSDPWPDRESVLQWWFLGLALGLLVSLANHVQPASLESTQHAAARTAVRLSGRLKEVARDLPLGLDASAVAQTLLDATYADVDVDVCAVLVVTDPSTVSPIALRGAARLPWRDPLRRGGTLQQALETQTAVREIRPEDRDGRRRGSSTLCLPILVDRSVVGLLVLERRGVRSFTDREVALAAEAVEWVAPQLQAAVFFSELQHSATVYEREQLAREMHNGVAQDLAFIGFGLDALGRLKDLPGESRADVEALRREVTRMMADIRLSINELRGGVRPDQGLGRVLSTQVQHFGSTTGTAVQVELRESPARLPVDVELAIARLTHELLLDARTGKATSVKVTLDSEPPSALFVLEHDGATAWCADRRSDPQLERVDARLQVLRPQDDNGLMVVVHVGPRSTAQPTAIEVELPSQAEAAESAEVSA